jgi:hypothetical protein
VDCDGNGVGFGGESNGLANVRDPFYAMSVKLLDPLNTWPK